MERTTREQEPAGTLIDPQDLSGEEVLDDKTDGEVSRERFGLIVAAACRYANKIKQQQVEQRMGRAVAVLEGIATVAEPTDELVTTMLTYAKGELARSQSPSRMQEADTNDLGPMSVAETILFNEVLHDIFFPQDSRLSSPDRPW